jgi:hypothetical protein
LWNGFHQWAPRLALSICFFLPLTALGPACDLLLSPADLPQRPSLGDLDYGSFRLTDGGWCATYRSEDPRTIVELEFRRAAPAFSIGSTWRGIAGPTSDVPTDGFASLAAAFMAFPEAWDQLAKHALAEGYNLQLVETPEQWPFNGFFPDGYAKTIICPIPVSQARTCVSWLDHVRENQRIRTPTSASLNLKPIRIPLLSVKRRSQIEDEGSPDS